MPIIFGSEEARAILQRDFERRNGHIRRSGVTSPRGGTIPPPTHYVPGDWRDAFPPEDDEDDQVDEPGELSGGNIVRSGWGKEHR